MEERLIEKVCLYGTWVANKDIGFVVSELSRSLFEYEVMHVHRPIKHRFKGRGVFEDGHGRDKSDRAHA